MTPQAKEAREDPHVQIALLQQNQQYYERRLDAAEKELADLKQKKERLTGVLAVLTFLWPFAAQFIMKVLTK